ncbi:expressed unknown protein [Seminavis robusta]|uniref:Uncharacterized protein n=1 Tax=Seminavis robusta TaxID=568900 RepID=A0A9N8EEP1_9STRA|nr:expressed unknown protein [Seminavis robusta]|eukprot:Sro1014_g231430.1 n/a (291) ;mRNA; f:19444-20316
MANLLTHHDFYHIHAACGLVALLHFFYRLRLIVLDVENAGFARNLGEDLVSMVILALPNLTSYLFTVVNVKKGNDGFSIWKEYRGHSFVYAAKLWLVNAMQLYAEHFQPDEGLQYERAYRVLAEFGTMLGLQYVTQQYPKQESTIRGMYKSPFTVFFVGYLQFLARAGVLYGAPDPRDNITAVFLGVMIVQMNAFNMTLRKKRIIGPKTTQAFYTTLLGGALYLLLLRRLWAEPPTGIFDPRFKNIYLALLAYSCRRQGFDRFSSWIIALSAMALIDQHFDPFKATQGQQ